MIQGPPSDVPATHETDLLLTAFRVANDNPPSYALQDLSTTHYLAIFRDTPVARLEKTSQHPLRLRAVSTSWGAVCLAAPAHDSDKKHSDSWLMTGPRGRLEVRSHSRAWETLQVEVVRQSYDAVLSELPVHGVFRVAEQTLRNAVCEKVEKEITAKDVRSKVKHGGFNHSAALAGMSDAPKVVGSKASAKMRKKQPTSVKNAPVGTASKAPVAAAVAASSLPRNKASKKAAKRNKKKKRKGKMTTDSGAQGHYVANVPARESSVGLEQESSAVAEDNESKLAKDALLTSEKQKGGTANQKSVTGSGPPCSACGRQVSGTYTTAMGRYFHPQCFCCGICRRPMGVGAGQFRERDGIPYCQGCFATQLASRCARCSKPILETVITAMEKTWHKDCLTCTICRLPLTQTFWLYADKPNEPRCSRCVTGEEYVTSRQGSSKMVNLPMFGRKNTTSGFPAMGQGNAAGGGIGGTGQSGRVQLISPVLPSTSRQ